jgi:hypothetical protein
MASSGILHRVALVRTDVSEELSASFIRIFLLNVRRLQVTVIVVPSSPILVTLMMEKLSPPKRRSLQESHDVTTPKTQLFIVIVVKTSNLT